jgi:DASH complex subunit DAD3
MDPPPRPQSSLLASPPELSPLEQEVLEEYERLAENMKKVRSCPTRRLELLN